MTKRAKYRKSQEEHLFKKVIEWALDDNEPILVEIVKRAFADYDAENWLTLHLNSSFTGLTGHYFQIVTEEQNLLASQKRLLERQLKIYYKRLAS